MMHPEFDAYTKDLSELITYSAQDIVAFHLYSWEWVDNLHFMLPPSRLIEDETRRTQLEEGVRRRLHRGADPGLLHRGHAEWRDLRGLSVNLNL